MFKSRQIGHERARRRGSTRPAYSLDPLETRRLLAAYFVSPNGNDANPGTAEAPWKTLQRAAEVVIAGDQVTVRAGTYAGFDLQTDGTPKRRIVFAAEPGAVINDRNPRTPDGINLEGADYITIEGFQVQNTAGTISRAGIRSVTNTGVILRGNVCDSNGRWGIFTGFSEQIVIENNETSRSGLEHGIYHSNSADNPVIRGNRSWGNRGCGIHMNGDKSMGGDGVISGALVEGNIIYDNGRAGGSGINGDAIQRSVIRNNLIYNNHASGISLYRIDGGAGASKNLVINNTILMADDARWCINIQGGSTGNVLRNNVLCNANSRRGSISISADSLEGFASDYNVLVDRLSATDGERVMSLDAWQKIVGQDAHSFLAIPSQLFVDFARADFRLSKASPAIDTGSATQAPASDLGGVDRPQGTSIDIGAFERSTEHPKAAPAPE